MKPGSKMKIWMMAFGIMATAFVRAQDSTIHRFSVQQAIDYAHKNNVQVRNALLDIKIQQQVNRDVTSAAYPQINGTGSFIYNAAIPVSLIPGEFLGQPQGTFVPLKFGVKYNATAGVSLDQLLFDGQVFVGLQARQTVMDFSEKNAEITEEMIKVNIAKIYYQLVVSRTQMDILDANIDRLEKLLHDTKEIYKNGFAEKLDVDKVSVQLANVQTDKVRALTQIANGYLGLKVLMGMPVTDSLILTDEINDEKVKEGLADTVGFQYSNRKEYQYAELGIRLNQYQVKRYQLSKYPTLSLNAYYNENAQRNEFTFLKSGGTYPWYDFSAVTLRLNVPIFHGNSTNAKIAQAKLGLQKSINQRNDLKLSIDNEIATSRNNFAASIATLDFQKKNMDLAESVYNQTKKKYEAGTGSQDEINNAQADLRTAQTNYVTALYAAIISRIDYLKATGKL